MRLFPSTVLHVHTRHAPTPQAILASVDTNEGTPLALHIETTLCIIGSGPQVITMSYSSCLLYTSRYRTYIARRAQRIPVAYITGRKEFMSVDFCVEDGVLIPRPDTEVLIDETVKFLNSRSLRAPKVLDLCTGTGAIACSLAREFSEATVVATDISEKAIAVARRNVENLGLSRNMTVIQGDLYLSLIHI